MSFSIYSMSKGCKPRLGFRFNSKLENTDQGKGQSKKCEVAFTQCIDDTYA